MGVLELPLCWPGKIPRVGVAERMGILDLPLCWPGKVPRVGGAERMGVPERLVTWRQAARASLKRAPLRSRGCAGVAHLDLPPRHESAASPWAYSWGCGACGPLSPSG